jgi:hypothetical protein
MPILRCANSNCKAEIAKLEKPLPKVVAFCCDECDAIHNRKLSTVIIRYREGLKK